MPVNFVDDKKFEATAHVIVVGAGLCGLIAALAARDAGADVLLVEREDNVGGAIQMGRGLIPAAGTSYQRDAGIADSPGQFAADMQRKSKGSSDVRLTLGVATAAAPAIEWLADDHELVWRLEVGRPQSGHSRQRLHGVPERSGVALVRRLEEAARRAGIAIVTGSQVLDLYADRSGRVSGVMFRRPSGMRQEFGCHTLVLATGGFAANTGFLRRYIPEVAGAQYVGHRGSAGDALYWATQLGAALKNTSAYFARAALAVPYWQLTSRLLIAEGGVQVNLKGERFGNEVEASTDFAPLLIAQPQGLAWTVYDERIHSEAMLLDDYRELFDAGAVRHATSIEALAALIGVPVTEFGQTIEHVINCQRSREVDLFGRDMTHAAAFGTPLYAVCVTTALINTLGGLSIDTRARVLRTEGGVFPNLYAAGHASSGVTGSHAWGYLPGSGWLSALSLGRIAGHSAAEQALAGHSGADWATK